MERSYKLRSAFRYYYLILKQTAELGSDQLYEQLYKKYFKKFYAGKPTKSYQKIMNQINQAEKIPLNEIERLMITG
ncbi:hypothetical protein ACFL6I_10225 [candidate division KSB1 bacterium]